MSTTMQRARVTNAVRDMLRAALDRPLEVAEAPPNVTNAGKLTKAHYILYPIPSAGVVPSMDDPHEDIWLEYQMTCIGLLREESEWMADAARAAWAGRQPSGAYTHPITLISSYVVDRSVSLFGGVVANGPGSYSTVDSYQLVVT